MSVAGPDNAPVIIGSVGEATFAERLRLRRAAAEMTQRELATASGVKQPLIAALESGARQPTAQVRAALDNALKIRPSQILRVARDQVLAAVVAIGAENVRVFGSVAHGTDGPDSDVDLLVTFPRDSDIVTLLALEEDLATLLTVPVDIVSAGSSSPALAKALAEAVPL